TVTFPVANGCLVSTLSATDLPIAIPDNDPLGITSSIAVPSGTMGTLSLSLHIAHPFRGDLVVTLISPGGSRFTIDSRQGDADDNLVVTDQSISAFAGQPAGGTCQLQVQDLAIADVGTLASWSMTSGA